MKSDKFQNKDKSKVKYQQQNYCKTSKENDEKNERIF